MHHSRWLGTATSIIALSVAAAPAAAQVDQARAAVYFKEAERLCTAEGGRLWGVSLCGPMVIADGVTHTIATNQPAPAEPQPPALGFANTALTWGGAQWTTLVWRLIPANDEHARGRLMMHELFHRVQPQLTLFSSEGVNDHLDTADGRYWMQLEWRALAKALGASGAEREAAVRDALAFRMARRAAFPGAAENERRLEINEGLAQYTGTVTGSETPNAALADAIQQLDAAPRVNATFVRSFAYPSGPAYGLLLDAWSPGWTRRITVNDDIGAMLMAAAALTPSPDAAAAALRYGGVELRVAEEKRDAERKARIAELRRRFVDGPVLLVPAGRSYTFNPNGITPIPGEGTIYPGYGTDGDWGRLDAVQVLVAADRTHLALPAPASVAGTTLTGDGWTLKLAPGWVVRPGTRSGDYRVVADSTKPPG